MMKFTKELLANKIFEATDLSFDFTSRGKREIEGFDPMFDRSAVLQSDGCWLLRLLCARCEGNQNRSLVRRSHAGGLRALARQAELCREKRRRAFHRCAAV